MLVLKLFFFLFVSKLIFQVEFLIFVADLFMKCFLTWNTVTVELSYREFIPHVKTIQREQTHHSVVWRWFKATVDGEKAAAHEYLCGEAQSLQLPKTTFLFLHYFVSNLLLFCRPSYNDVILSSNLNELLSSVKLRHQHILSVRQPGEGHAEPPWRPQVGILRELLQQRLPHRLQHPEGRVENSQCVFSGLLCQV